MEKSNELTRNVLHERLLALIEDYTAFYGNRTDGISALGEQILWQANAYYAESKDVSWQQLMAQLRHRAGM